MFSFSKIFKYIWPLIRKYKWSFYIIIALFALRVTLDFVVIPLYLQKLIDLISSAGSNRLAISGQISALVFVIIGLHFLVTISARTRGAMHLEFLVKMFEDLRNFAFQKLELNSYSFFSNTFAGSLVTKSKKFVFSFETIFDTFIFNFVQTTVLLMGVFVVLFQKSLLISLYLLILLIIHISIVVFFISKKYRLDRVEAEQDSRISGRVADVFGNILAVKFFSGRENEIKSFGEYTADGSTASRKAVRFATIIDVAQSAFGFIIQSILIYVLINLWLENKISTGMIVLVTTYTSMILVRLVDFGNALVRFMKAVADMQEMIDIFEIKPDILDPQNPEKVAMKEGHIVFKDVSFKYQMGEEVLSNFNLDIKHGERVGIVGHSGAGKSTITKLLLRFNDITSGQITIDGQDIRNVIQDDLRSVISYVPQEPILFHRPIKENINYGKPDATDKEIIEVAKKAHADEFISKLPHGYDTLVGERGVKLSGGERQRVAIARAMLKDSPILMLDEATSSLDSISESYIQDAFNELMKGKTTIVIAHRLSTIQKMDRIIVLDKGKIVEEGTHKELLAKGGLYADLWDHQTGGFLE